MSCKDKKKRQTLQKDCKITDQKMSFDGGLSYEKIIHIVIRKIDLSIVDSNLMNNFIKSMVYCRHREFCHLLSERRYQESENGIMCEALREFFADELEEAVEKNKREMLLHALKSGSSAYDIARILSIPLETVETVQRELLEVV